MSDLETINVNLRREVEKARQGKRDCEHGQLARSCELCEVIADRAALARGSVELNATIAHLRAVIDSALLATNDFVSFDIDTREAGFGVMEVISVEALTNVAAILAKAEEGA